MPRPDVLPQLTVANRYLHGELAGDVTANRLGSAGIFGRLLAGEIYLDQATKDKPHYVTSRVRMAERSYTSVVRATCNRSPDDADASSGVKAGMRLAQLTAFTVLYAQRRLPQRPSTVEDMYNRLLRHATATSEAV